MVIIIQQVFWQIKIIFRGIDIVKFGESISIIQRRITFENISVLEVYKRQSLYSGSIISTK